MAGGSISIYAGDDHTLNLSIVDLSNHAVDITSYSIYFGVKINPQDTTFIIQKSVGSGITITAGSGGLATIAVGHADTKVNPGKYIYQVDVVDPGGFRTTIMQDNFTILPSVLS